MSKRRFRAKYLYISFILIGALLSQPLAFTPPALAEADDNIPGVPLSGNSISGTLDANSDPHDVYRFDLMPNTTIAIVMMGTPGADFDLRLFGPESGNDVDTAPALVSSENDTSNEVIIYNFIYPPEIERDYYLDVFAYSGSGEYAIGVETSSTVERLWGETSEGTAEAISKEGWPLGSKYVLLARDDYFTDALAGVPLAYKFYDLPEAGYQAAPLLLTNPKTLSPEARREIERLQAETVIILGGPGAVLPEVETQLAQIPAVKEVQRIWGHTAPGTAKDIFERIRGYAEQTGTPRPETAIIATQVNFQDALAVSSPAAANNMPILLTNLYSLPPETLEALSQGGIKNIIIVGGGAVVSANVEAELNARGYPVLARLWGPTEYDTAIDIATTGDRIFGFDYRVAVIARGDYFTDALAAGPVAAGEPYFGTGPFPLILTEPRNLPVVSRNYIISTVGSSMKIYILGGPRALAQEVENKIRYFTGY